MVFAIAHMTVTNPDALAEYRAVAAQALAKHGGKVESASADLTVLDGVPALPSMVAVLSFPDKAAALGWAHDPELAEIHALRQGAGRSDIFLVG